MVEVKEIVNTSNKEVFINKKYLRQRAIEEINNNAFQMMTYVRKESDLADMLFDGINATAHTLVNLEILNESEVEAFMHYLIECRHNENAIEKLIAPILQPCGYVTTKQYTKEQKEKVTC